MQKIYEEKNDCKECNDFDVSLTTLWSKKKQDIKKSSQKTKSKQQSVRPSNLTQQPLESIHKNVPELTTEGFETDEPQKMISDSFNTKNSSISMNDMRNYLKKITNYLSKMTDYPMKIINNGTLSITSFLCKMLSKKTTNEDIELVKSRFKILLSILISYYIIYNWYFVMFFRNPETGIRIPVMDLSMKTLMDIKPLNYLFKYILCVISTVDWLLITKYPTIMKGNTPQLNMILLLLIIIYVVSTMGEGIIGDFSKYLNMGKTGYTGTFIMFSVFYGIYSFIQELANKAVGDPSILSLISSYYLITHYRNFGILHVISYILRIIWSTMIHYLWGLLVVVYVLIMSFFAIFIYSEHSLFDTIKQINKFINENIIIIDEDKSMINSASKLVSSGIDNLKNLSELDPSGKIGKIGKIISIGSSIKSLFDLFIKMIYNYLFELIIIISLFYTMIIYGTNINDVELKSGLISLNFAFILLVAGYIYHKYTLLNKMMKVSPTPDG